MNQLIQALSLLFLSEVSSVYWNRRVGALKTYVLANNNNSFVSLDDATRVCLQPIPGLQASDYINANFIDVSTTTSQ